MTVDNFDAARSLCESNGGDLAIVNKEGTNQALVLYLLAVNSKCLIQLQILIVLIYCELFKVGIS